MALDALVDSTQLNSDLTDVADAIRAKTGGTDPLAFPNEFISEIGSISGGGGTYQLLASGTYTNTVRATMNIPVTYSGTPTMVAVILNTTPTPNVAKTIAWLNGLIQLPNSIQTDFGLSIDTLNHAQAVNNNYSFQHSASCTLYADNIECKSYTGAYHPDIGTYDWYIWGVA